MKPTSITAPGVKVFMSNLTKPADSNALSAVDKDVRELRYGTRLMQAVVGMNCVGGTRMTNANRSAILFPRNPVTGESIVIERSIEDLLERADRNDLDPFILPGDAIACYDSAVRNVVDVARSLTIMFALPLERLHSEALQLRRNSVVDLSLHVCATVGTNFEVMRFERQSDSGSPKERSTP